MSQTLIMRSDYHSHTIFYSLFPGLNLSDQETLQAKKPYPDNSLESTDH